MICYTRGIVCLAALLVWLSFEAAAADQTQEPGVKPAETTTIREYRSARLHVQTDLLAVDAAALCERLERTLVVASRYWGKKPRGQIRCYVAHDLAAWTDAQLPHRLARVIIGGIGGATVPKVVGTGKQSRNLPTVYASSRPGVAEHELIHAYCVQTFGSTGPEWYKEGMAEMAVSRSTRESGIQCSVEQFQALQAGNHTSLAEILAVGSTGQRISESLRRMVDDPASRGKHVPADVWTDIDSDNVARARDEYLQSWAFCYMMLHNPNYSKRFRSLGTVFIGEQRNAFDDFFAPVRGEVEFEFQFLLKHASSGYRADLCAWDWRHRFRSLGAGESHTARAEAGKGFQPSGVTVVRGQAYAYHTDGQWSLSADSPLVDADGDENGGGQLVGVVLDDWTLGEPFPLGTSGTLQPSANGKLYLRCRDAWNEIADNIGQITITIRGN